MTTPPEKSRYHHGDLRQSLISAAAQFIRSEGEAALSMRKLAALAGVSRTAPYHHFADKTALLCAIAEQGFIRYQSHINQVYEELHEQDLDTAWIKRFCHAYLQFSQENSEYYDLMFGAHIWRDKRASEELQKVAADAFKAFVEQVSFWQRQGWIHAELEPLRVAQVSWSSLHGMSRLLVDGIYLDNQALISMVDAAAQMLSAYMLRTDD